MEKWKEEFNTIIQLGLLICAALGVFFVKQELELLRTQAESASENIELLKANTKFSQKPYGTVISVGEDEKGEIKPLMSLSQQEDEPDEFKVKMTPVFVNTGETPMVFIAAIGYRSTELIENFTKHLLSGGVNYGDLKYTQHKIFISRTHLVPGQSRRETFDYYGLKHQREYYFYSVYFYKDIMGNLYLTEHIDVINLGAKRFSGNKLQPQGIENYNFKDIYTECDPSTTKQVLSYFQKAPGDDKFAKQMYEALSKKSD